MPRVAATGAIGVTVSTVVFHWCCVDCNRVCSNVERPVQECRSIYCMYSITTFNVTLEIEADIHLVKCLGSNMTRWILHTLLLHS